MSLRVTSFIFFALVSHNASAATEKETIFIKAGLALHTCEPFGNTGSKVCRISDTTATTGVLSKIAVELERRPGSDTWETRRPVNLEIIKGTEVFSGRIEISLWKNSYSFHLTLPQRNQDDDFLQPQIYVQNIEGLKYLPMVTLPGAAREMPDGKTMTPILYIASEDHP